MIACEQNNRKSYLMELDAKYVDVIVKRWEEYTGKKAELLANTEETPENNAELLQNDVELTG